MFAGKSQTDRNEERVAEGWSLLAFVHGRRVATPRPLRCNRRCNGVAGFPARLQGFQRRLECGLVLM